ncbi:MFS general substrate transporter [Pyrrhoderma noxium]|uniref:MFS general substrate transporter n=1 Tax=Pyrrhoderma noxium TaxID=2282107 RepID=A0A286UQI7_9AGAM|nr:MFS general substrate transporter [Pyrrhoderma noxium]
MHEFASPPHPPEPADTKSLSDATVTSIASDGDCSPRKMSVGSVSMPKAGLKDESLSFLRLLLAHIGAALALFLATTDATIVSTSLPTIIANLNASQNQYPWVGVSYAVSQTALQPLYGQFSDLLGRKIVLFGSISMFMIGSLLCGTASDYVLLCVYRAVAGMGGGGIVSSVWLITAELVAEEQRAKWSQALSVTWSASAVAGPLLGGVFSDSTGLLSWRWAFFINLPIATVAAVLLFFSLKDVPLRPAKGVTWRKLWNNFDLLGLILFMSGTVGLVLGFSFSSQFGWNAPATLVPLVLGFLILIIGYFYEKHTNRDALFPSRMLNNVTVGTILIISFLHNFAFNAGTFFLALYYQAVNGSSALEAGLRMLPYSLGSSLASMPTAWFIAAYQCRTKTTAGQKIVIIIGLAIATIGFGLLTALSNNTPTTLQEIAPLIAGIGIGMLFHSPYQVLTKALHPEDIASATSAFFLVRFTGATCGLAVASAVFNERLALSDYAELLGSAASIDLRSLAKLRPIAVREDVLKTVASAIQFIWIVCTPCLGVGLLISPLIKTTSTEVKQKSDPEKNVPQV